MSNKPRKQQPARKSQLTPVEKARLALQGLGVCGGKKVPSYAAELWRLEREEWWQTFKADERRATKAIFDKLAARGIIIHRKSNGLCHILEGEDSEEGFKVTGSQQMPQQLINSPLNLKRWRQDHRLLKHLFKLYLRQTPHVRFFTLSQGPVKLADLDGAITKLHNDIGRLAHRSWIKEAGLEFVLRKTELPPQNAGQPGNEQVFLHAHIAVSCQRRLSKINWQALKQRLEKQSAWKHKPHDAGEIKDIERHTDYLFKNPLASHEQDPADQTKTTRTYKPLEDLTPDGTEALYHALKGKRLVCPTGDFAQFIRELETKAAKERKMLKLETRFIRGQMQNRLVQVAKAKPRPGDGETDKTPLKDFVIANLPAGDQPKHRRLIVKGYTGATVLPGVKTKPDMILELITPDNSPHGGKRRIVAYWSLIKKTEAYIQRLGEKQFQSYEIDIPIATGLKFIENKILSTYDYHLINAAMEAIPWLKPVGKARGKWRRWRVATKHPNFPGWKKEPRNYLPASLPGSGLSYVLPPDTNDPYKPGYRRTCRALRKKQKREQWRQQRKQIGNQAGPTASTP